MLIVLTIHDPRPGWIGTRSILLDGDTELAAQIADAARSTPDADLTLDGARIHVAAEPTTCTIRAGRIVAVRTREV